MTLPLTDDEREAVNSALRMANLKAKHAAPLALDNLLAKWTAFVTQVEKGYGLSIYDYTNDLSARDLLERSVRLVESPLREKLLSAYEGPDGRFREATRESARPLLPGKAGWWWKRIPLKLEHELRHDLENEELL